MSVVIVGGNDRMVRIYKETCSGYGCNAKIFTQPQSNLARQIGMPDLLILFTSTVSHKMVSCALQEARRCGAIVARSHSSSRCALCSILSEHCNACCSDKEKLCHVQKI